MNKQLLSSLLIIGISTAGAQSIMLQDFDGQADGALSYESGSILGAADNVPITGVAPDGVTSVANVIDSGSGDKFLRMGRNFAASQSVTVAQLIDLSAVGGVTGQAYRITFDYRIDQVGTGSFRNSTIKFGIAEHTATGFQQYKNIANALGDYVATIGTPVLNYSDTTGVTIAAGSQPTGWTTFSSTETFTFDSGTQAIAFLITGMGFGSSGSFDAANYTYLDIDNIQIVAIPEPGTYALIVGIGLLALTRIRRRR